VQALDAAVAGGEQAALQKRRTDAVALPRLLDAEGGLGRIRERRAQEPQFGDPTQDAVDEKAVQDDAGAVGRVHVPADGVVVD